MGDLRGIEGGKMRGDGDRSRDREPVEQHTMTIPQARDLVLDLCKDGIVTGIMTTAQDVMAVRNDSVRIICSDGCEVVVRVVDVKDRDQDREQ